MTTSLLFDVIARDRASNTFDKVGDSASRSSGKLKKWAMVGGAAVGAAAVVAGKALWDMGKAAIEDEKSQKTLAVALKNSTGATKGQVGAVEDWITKQGKAKGIADDELRPALSRLVAVTKDVGKAQELTSLAMDVSAGTGKSLKTVTEALQKAQNGSLGGLSRLGVATKDAEGKEKSLAQVTRELADLHGGQAAKAADTNEGKIRRLKLMYDETKESIGAKLLPVVGKMADFFLNKVVPAAGQVGDWFQQKLLPPIRDFAEKHAPKANAIMDALKGAFQDAKPFIELVGKIITNVVVPGLGKLLDAAGPALVGALRTIGKVLGAIGDAGKWMWNNMLQPAFSMLAKAIGVVLEGFSSMLKALGKVPGFGWAEKAADSMAKAAAKAQAVADGIKKIPDRKNVYVAVKYTYSGLRGRGGTGTTRSGDANDPSTYLPRMAQDSKPMAQRVMEAIADGLQAGGKKVDKILLESKGRIKDKLGAIRDEMKSFSSSIASALNPTDFGGGIAELTASLTNNNFGLGQLMSVFEKLKGSVSTGFLSALMQSGNVGLATALGNDTAAAANASAMFDQNAALAQNLGDQTAQAVMGDQITKAIKDEVGQLLKALKDDIPAKQAKKIRQELEGLRIELTGGGRGGGQGAHVRGAW